MHDEHGSALTLDAGGAVVKDNGCLPAHKNSINYVLARIVNEVFPFPLLFLNF